MTDGLDRVLELAVGIGEDAVHGHIEAGNIYVVPEQHADVVGTVAAVFITGMEIGMRLGITAGGLGTKEFLSKLTKAASAGPVKMEPLEIRERHMQEDIDAMLGVATIKTPGLCPDCGGTILYDEAAWHLVCGGCGQLVREPDD